MRETKHLLFPSDFPSIRRNQLTTLQVNLGYKCNQSCTHCHVNAGPTRTEMMDDETLDLVIEYISEHNVALLDVTGGAPELHPRFRQLVVAANNANVTVRDRCNLTILFEPKQEDLAKFLADNQVEIVASLPCYTEENVNKQRGKGVFSLSIEALQLLNKLGYAENKKLNLHLVFNPSGPVLPPSQVELEQEYKKRLSQDYGIYFNELFVITNMPIQRFGSSLLSTGHFESYMNTLRNNHQTANLSTVMCKDTVSIDWQGNVYDCDFNQMLEEPLHSKAKRPLHISDLFSTNVTDLAIKTGNHCYGCTAGQGSSCSGALSST
ncbi:MAG: arsenosugar biosynthesis radical SAM protein ArsS [Gammaproteobacteria bacterium]|nr:arsenosugar biosynthesis radical SAM protein ArsS [Gammaproteobacteria bacterium]